MKSILQKHRRLMILLVFIALPYLGWGERISNNLVALYTFDEGSGDIVHDTSGVIPAIDLTIADPGHVTWIPGALRINASTIISSLGPATKILNSCQLTNSITLEAWMKPNDNVQGGPARILTLSVDTSYRNFTLAQDGQNYLTRLRTTVTSDNGMPSLDTSSNLVQPILTHLLYTRTAGGLRRLYVNGNLEAEDSTLVGDLSNWDLTFGLALVNEFTMNRTWLGELHLIAIYTQALSFGAVTQNYNSGANPTPTANPTIDPTAVIAQKATFYLASNSFHPLQGESLTITLDLTQSTSVDLSIYNLLGEKVRKLYHGHREAGNWQDIFWDGKDDQGQVLAASLYFIQIQTDYLQERKKVIIIK